MKIEAKKEITFSLKYRNTFSILGLIISILITIIAAYYSITGLTKIFSGSVKSIYILATTLEIGKICVIVFLHLYWNILPKFLKTYLLLASLALMLITSLGVYGFLSNSNDQTKVTFNNLNSKVEILEVKRKIYEDRLKQDSIRESRLLIQKNEIQINDLKSSNDNFSKQEKLIDSKVRNLDSIASFNLRIAEIQSIISSKTELGPINYISKLTGFQLDSVVMIFILLLIFVFDPLAIVLLISSIFILKYKIPEEEISIENEVEEIKEELIPEIIPVEEPIVRIKRKYVRKKPLKNQSHIKIVADEKF